MEGGEVNTAQFKKLPPEEQKLHVAAKTMENLPKFYYVEAAESFWTDTPSGQMFHALILVRQKPLGEWGDKGEETFMGMRIIRGE